MFRKILTLLMSMTLILSIAACGGGSDTDFSSGGGNSSVSSGGNFNANLKAQILNCTPIIDYAKNTSVDQMDTVTFGLDEKSEPIEWLVLEKSNNKALLLSKYVFTTHNYNGGRVDITWENSTIRNWLNSEYINTIFSKKEQGSILTTDVINNDNAEWGTKGGNNTRDKLFLLSIDEVNEYFSSDNQRVATYKDGDSYRWWLRSPGGRQYWAAYVNGYGELNETGDDAYEYFVVRPALWVRY